MDILTLLWLEYLNTSSHLHTQQTFLGPYTIRVLFTVTDNDSSRTLYDQRVQ